MSSNLVSKRLRGSTPEREESLQNLIDQLGNDSSEVGGSIAPLDAENFGLFEAIAEDELEVKKRLEESYHEFKSELAEKEVKDFEERENKKAEFLKQVRSQIFDFLGGLASTLIENEKKEVEDRYNAEKENIETTYKFKKKEAKGDIAEQQRLEEELNEKKKELERNAAKDKKKIAVKEAIIQGLLSVVEAAPNLALMALAAAVSAANVIQIQAQKFAGGGQVLAPDGTPLRQLPFGKIRRGSNGPTLEGGDNVYTVAKPGEAYVNKDQQSKIQSLAGADIFFRAGIPGFPNPGKQSKIDQLKDVRSRRGNGSPVYGFAAGGLIGESASGDQRGFNANTPQITDPNITIDREMSVYAQISQEDMKRQARIIAEEVADSIVRGLKNQELEKRRQSRRNGNS